MVDKNNERIQKLSTTGEHVAQWGSVGDKPGQFSSPIGIAIDGQGNVVVADSGNERVQRFGLDGRLWPTGVGTATGRARSSIRPRHCDGSTGQCVRDRHRHRPGADIHVVRSSGQTVGQNGQGPRRILDPTWHRGRRRWFGLRCRSGQRQDPEVFVDGTGTEAMGRSGFRPRPVSTHCGNRGGPPGQRPRGRCRE